MTRRRDYDRGTLWLLNQLAGTVPELCAKATLVEAKRKARATSGIADDDPRLRAPAPALITFLEADRNRIMRIEDKARGTVVGITIAVSVAGAGIGIFGKGGILDSGGAVTYLAAGVLVVGLGYLLLSGWFALSAYAASPLHMPDVQDRPETRKSDSSSGNTTGGVDSSDDTVWRSTLLECLDLNRFLATQKTNRFAVSIALLRNGLVSIFGFALLAIAGALTR